MKVITIALFVLMVVAQWFVPLSTIFQQESVRENGRIFRFKTQPIDPTDPFRGKYIVLRFEVDEFRTDTTESWERGETIYLTLEDDSAGFAAITGVSKTPPAGSSDYIQARTTFDYGDGLVGLKLPFDRFYLEESKASDAERAYWEATADTTQVAYAEVAVSGGNSALLDVKISGKSIVAIVEEINRTKEDQPAAVEQ